MTALDQRDVFATAADHIVDLVGRIGADQWDRPGLGAWTIRALVGHTGRALTTVADYIDKPAETCRIADAADYYLTAAAEADAESVRRRGEQAGAALGDDPVSVLAGERDRALAAIARVDNPIVTTVVGGMRLLDYLPSRTCELAVHGLDIARALGVAEPALPRDVTEVASTVLAAVAARRGDGVTTLLALTGRTALPEGFTVV
ncbi:MAG: maleylpyruvate isomerase N-terminal domain-containing protein [Actinomycetota bacterium]|nr:maleylpyruvate isomerase N-terminal domain-containing protein [Actinomycetota bacterium]